MEKNDKVVNAVDLNDLTKKTSEIEEAEKAVKVQLRVRTNTRAGRFVTSEKEWME